MGDSHRHLEITEKEWGSVHGRPQQTLNKFDVPPPEQEELKAIIESTHDAIVIIAAPIGDALTRGSTRLPRPTIRAKGTARDRREQSFRCGLPGEVMMGEELNGIRPHRSWPAR